MSCFTSDTPDSIFTPAFARFHSANHIAVLLGRYLSSARLLEAHGVLRLIERQGIASIQGYTWDDVRAMREAVRITRLVTALNKGRKWALARLVEQMHPMLLPGIALAVVPPHDPWITDAPIRKLAQQLAASGESRTDATPCLIRHTKITRIVFGGKSNRTIHRDSIRVEHRDLVQGRRVLLLDDIAKSGQSLLACRSLLYEAGASFVQMAVLGRLR